MKNQTSIRIISSIIGLAIAGSVTADDRKNKRPRYVSESVEVSDHVRFGTEERVDGASIIIRDFYKKVVHATITTRALDPESAYSVWVAVFNRPRFCAISNDCKVSDLGNEQVKASVFWGGGMVSDANGTATTSFRLVPGRTNRELFGRTKDYGLQNIRWGEIHLVVRGHGPAGLAGPIAQQIGTADEACPPEGCKNLFASIHKTTLWNGRR